MASVIRCIRYSLHGVRIGAWNSLQRVGVNLAPFLNFYIIREMFDVAQVPIRFVKSLSYLTSVTAVQLRWHPSNGNVIFNSYNTCFYIAWDLGKFTSGKWLSDPHPRWRHSTLATRSRQISRDLAKSGGSSSVETPSGTQMLVCSQHVVNFIFR